MKNKTRIIITLVALLVLVFTSTVSAQYSGYSWSTAYQVVNMGEEPADITISYYDSSGAEVTDARKTLTDVPAGSSQLVVQFTDDPDLPSGRYSAVISADQPIAAIANQQLVATGASSYNPAPPFSSYSGKSTGSTSVTLPAVMYNWYGYYTDVYIMNVGTGAASDVSVEYIPGEVSGQATGTAATENLTSIPQYASLLVSQQSKTNLGAGSGTFTGRFNGTATITSGQPIIAVVNQHNASAYKLMTYNGFAGSEGATSVAAPVHMKGFYGYYSTLMVANPGEDSASVTLTYTPSGTANAVSSGTVGEVTATFDVGPGETLSRHDGPTATADQTDLDNYTRFYGSVLVTSDNPVVVQVNVEAVASGDDQAGSYNGISTSEATTDIVVPVILADFYGYYTTLVVQNTTDTAGSCNITYTSDGSDSSVKNHSETYTHPLPASGSFSVYEGRKGGVENGDINSDTAWRSGTAKIFIGAASISCTVNAVAFVNEESDVNQRDSMYTMNTFNK